MTSPPPPIPRRADYSLLWLLLGVLLFATGLVFAGVYVFSRYIARQITMDIRNIGSGRSVREAHGRTEIALVNITEAGAN